MKRRVLILLGIILLPAHPCFALEVTFRATASVDGMSVTLADIADFNDQSGLAKALGSQAITVSPSPGKDILIRSENVKRYLLGTLPVPGSVQWRGSSTILVHRNGITVGPEKIQSVIAGYLRKKQKDLPKAEIRFIPKNLPLPFILPAGDLTWEVIPSNPGILSSSSISIIFYVDSHVRKNMAIRGKIEAKAQVLVAQTTIQRGTIINSDQIKFITKDIAEYKSPCFEAHELVGKKTNRTIRSGSIIEHSMIDIPPMVERGQIVKIVLNSGALHLTTKGVAGMKGGKDQIVRVRNLSSKKLIYCRVAAPGIVEAQL